MMAIDTACPTVKEIRGQAMESITSTKGTLEIHNLSAWYGKRLAVNDVNMSIKTRAITAIIGPSGCGKSTFIRCLNRMHEVSSGGRMSGRVLLDGQDIYDPAVDPVM